MIDVRQQAQAAQDLSEYSEYEENSPTDDTPPTNEELLRKMQNNELPYAAFSKLVQANSKRFYGLAYRLLGSREDAEDIVQTCFMRIWHASDMFDESKGALFTTWFSRVVINECRMKFRKSARNAAQPNAYADFSDQDDYAEAAISDQDDIVDELADRQRAQNVKDAIEALPDRQKEALVLCFYEGFTNREAAEIMEVGVKALESLLMRAKKQLKEMLNDDA